MRCVGDERQYRRSARESTHDVAELGGHPMGSTEVKRMLGFPRRSLRLRGASEVLSAESHAEPSPPPVLEENPGRSVK